MVGNASNGKYSFAKKAGTLAGEILDGWLSYAMLLLGWPRRNHPARTVSDAQPLKIVAS